MKVENMKRHPALIPLSHDHHHGLLLAQLIKKNAPGYKGMPKNIEGKLAYTKSAWKNELKKHFENEEVILFPLARGRDIEIDKLIGEIIEEHIEIRNLIASLDDDSGITDKLDKLGSILENHIRKEERLLFKKIQGVLSENELKSLEGKIMTVKEG